HGAGLRAGHRHRHPGGHRGRPGGPRRLPRRAILMLELDGVETCYGASQVLFGMSLVVRAGEVVALLGRNGMGKTTTVRTIRGRTPPGAGRTGSEGRPIHGLREYRIAQAGLGLVPEGRQVFPNLTVLDNLTATAANRRRLPAPWTVARVFDLFPTLAA